MQKSRVLQSRGNTDRKPFTTIDDLILLSQELFARLKTFGEYKHPLAVRKGVKYMEDQNESLTVKAGATTYFFDLKKTKDGKPYLVITESRFKGENEERKRVSIAVFPEQSKEFVNAVTEMTAKLDK